MFNIKKISIVVVIIIIAFIGYSYMISGSKQSSSGVTKQDVSSSATTASSGSTALDGPGKEFVSQLLAIQNIKFNLTLFKDPVFMGLQDYSRELIPQESGRPNPFAPLEGDTSSSAAGATGGSFSGFTNDSTGDTSAVSGTGAAFNGSGATTGANAGTGSSVKTTPAKTTTPAKPIKK